MTSVRHAQASGRAGDSSTSNGRVGKLTVGQAYDKEVWSRRAAPEGTRWSGDLGPDGKGGTKRRLVAMQGGR